ncbi:csbD family protein [Asticcacaulis biprosthecium C19]|uniref:CsbD family protein n=1 Tax=Asticcacaulis biprosthecium C19 TaxID=715226 RepID=F4QIR2_9CAUL|nr:csbD family protein [Asticcacaulis biprosthecium C19]
MRGNVQKAWGKLTNDDLDVIEGDRKILSGKIQERYGVAQDEAERQIDKWTDEAVDKTKDHTH